MNSRMSRFAILLWLLWAVPVRIVGAQQGLQFPEDWSARIDAAVQKELDSQQIAGASIGIVLDGRLALTRGYGLADIESNRPATEHTVYNWASNSKPVMAVAAMQLVDAGKLDLDADIRTWLPDFPEKAGVITTRHLLCHQSGLPHYSNGTIVPLPSDATTDPLAERDPLVAIRRFAGSPLLFQPGEKLSYSSYAYVLLSAVVQEAGGQPVHEQLEQRIFRAIGAESLQLDLPFDNQPEWTTAYARNREGKLVQVKDVAHFWKHGAGGYKSSAVDFARWTAALVNNELVSEAAQKQMWTVQNTRDGQPTRYGLGFVCTPLPDGTVRIGHGGSQEETRTSMAIWPARKMAVVVMCNTAHAVPDRIALEIGKIVGADPLP